MVRMGPLSGENTVWRTPKEWSSITQGKQVV
jgi:hypothetical protein